MSPFALTWWTWPAVRLRRVSALLSGAWIDGVYLTAWPRAALFAPIGIFLFGLIEGVSHWSLQTYSGGQVSSNIHALDFVQMLPLLFIAAICGALSAQLGLLLVLGFAIGDFFIAGSPFGHQGWAASTIFFRLYVPQLISYLAFFLLAVTPALTGKVMAVSLPRWLRRPGLLSVSLAACIAVAVQGLSVYAWTLAVPMIVRVQWLWVGQQPAVSVASFLLHIDPWLPLTASAAMGLRLWVSVQAREKLDASRIASARNELRAPQRQTAMGVMPAVLKSLVAAVWVIALICGLFDSITRGAWVFGIVAALFLIRNLILPTLPVWAWWLQAVNRVPLLARWAAAIVGTFMVTRLLVSNPAYSPARDLTPGAFGPEIFGFLIGLVVSIALMPASTKSGVSPALTPTVRAGAKAFTVVCIFTIATRAYADVCMDPFCCFGANQFLAALATAALVVLALALLISGGFLIAALVEVGLTALLVGEGIEVTAEGLAAIRQYLLANPEMVEGGQNTMMIERLQTALDAGDLLTGADANFYLHELYEMELMSTGMKYQEAHDAALEFFSHSPYSLYAREVIDALPDVFNNNWRNYWGLKLL